MDQETQIALMLQILILLLQHLKANKSAKTLSESGSSSLCATCPLNQNKEGS